MNCSVGHMIRREPRSAIDSGINKSQADFTKPGTLVGIEIEMENYRNLGRNLLYWNYTGDGSLRDNGVEFVSRILGSRDIIPSLLEIEPWLKVCRDSWRAGIHVHVNVANLTVEQVMSVCKLYALMEPLIFAWEGNDRDKNNFCPPWSTIPTHPEALAAAVATIRELTPTKRADPDENLRILTRHLGGLHKYTALNLGCILRFGSIEFRLMRSTQDTNKIAQYVQLCAAIVNTGAESVDSSPLDLLSGAGADHVIDLLGTPFLKQVRDYDALVWEGVHGANIIHVADTPTFIQPLVDDVFDTPLLGEV